MQVFIYLAMIAISYYLNQQAQGKVEKQKPAAFSDWDFPQFDEGTPEAVVFGDVWQPDWFVLWYGNYRTKPVKTKSGK